jgi:hypothetical protein
MVARIVNLDVATFLDCQSSRVGENRISKERAALEPPSIEPASPAILAETSAVALGPQEVVNAAADMAPATKTLSAASALGDYHLPQELNRQDPEHAFQRLAEQWSSIPFRHLLLDSPKAAQARFLRESCTPRARRTGCGRLVAFW